MTSAPPSPLDAQDAAAIAAALRFLAAFFRAAPSAPDLAPAVAALREGALAREWPFGEPAALDAIARDMVAGLDSADLGEAYQRLFLGPHDFEAPAWGSVYLDKDNLLFGESTSELRAFLRRLGASMESGLNEPEDHVGLMLHLAADLLAAGRFEEAREALEQYFLPWSGRYLDLLAAHAGQPFYAGLAALTRLTLDGLAQSLALTPAPKPLYR